MPTGRTGRVRREHALTTTITTMTVNSLLVSCNYHNHPLSTSLHEALVDCIMIVLNQSCISLKPILYFNMGLSSRLSFGLSCYSKMQAMYVVGQTCDQVVCVPAQTCYSVVGRSCM